MTSHHSYNVRLLPYTEINGIRTLRDSDIVALYEKIISDGMKDVVFSDGEIANAFDFLTAMKYGNNKLFVVLADEEWAGVLWLNRFKSKTAHAHFCGFSSFWGKNTVDIGKKAINEVLHMKNGDNNEYLFDTLLGLIPVANIVAIKWVKKIGFIEVGVIPNGLWNEPMKHSEDGMLLCLTRGKS